MDTSVNERLNTMNQSVEAKKTPKIDKTIQRIEKVYEHMAKISNRMINSSAVA